MTLESITGPYVSYMTEGNFSGHVYKRTFYAHLMKPVNVSTSQVKVLQLMIFSDNLRKIFNGGAQLGGEWKAFKHLNVYADLTWGLNDIF